MKLPLVLSDSEDYNSKCNRMNVALKYSPKDNVISVIIFKFILEVINKAPLLNSYYLTYSFQGVLVEKKANLYIKISLSDSCGKQISSKKIWCSNNKLVYDFSKEIFFHLNDHNAENCSILLELKKHSGFGVKSKY